MLMQPTQHLISRQLHSCIVLPLLLQLSTLILPIKSQWSVSLDSSVSRGSNLIVNQQQTSYGQYVTDSSSFSLATAEQQHDYYNPDLTFTPKNNSNIIGGFDQESSIDLPHLSSLSSSSSYFSDKEYLSHDLAEKSCRLDRGCKRKDRLNNTYLSYCSRYKLENLLSNDILMSIMHASSDECERILDEFIQLDELINQFDRLFKNLLTRYNCHNGYSVKWSCEDCKKAYKDWLCATNLPYYMNGERIKPCISFCERVEQRCPYLHPITKEQYGGQPVFICRDPNIPFVPKITPEIPYSEPSKCYDLCHISDNLTELVIDSLSKYHYDKCPDKGSIAEEVRSDTLYCQLDLQAQQQQQQNQSSKAEIDDQFEQNNSFTTEQTNTNIETVSPNEHSNYEKTSTEVAAKPTTSTGTTSSPVHTIKLNELREVLTVYKSQPKTHSFGHHSEHK